MDSLRYFSPVLVFLFTEVIGGGRQCDTIDFENNVCSETEICDVSNTCQCLDGLVRLNDTFCIKDPAVPNSTPNSSSLVNEQGSGSLVAGILIPLFLILFVIFSVYVGKKYDLLTWIRDKLHQRNRNYDEFMIGQDDDDPPLP